MKKQTAVEYLESKIFGDEIFSLSKVFEQAKIIEKQQILDAHENGHNYYDVNGISEEQYYNETYKK